MEMKTIKILSLFDGISIARQAIINCGIDIEKYYASEIDKYAIQVAQKNFPDTIQVGSVVDLKGEDFKDIDLIIGGSPCQDLSIAKKNREGLSGARSGLFYEYVRILKEVKPKYFILENVNSMPKEAKQMITEELGVEPIMINAALVSAQNRKRLFWVGKLVGDKYEQVKMELPEDQGILLKDILESDVDEKYFLNDSYIKNLNRESYGAKGSIANKNKKTKTLTASMGCGGGNGIYVSRPSGAKTVLYLTNSKGKTYQQDLLQTTEGKCRTIPSGTHGSTPHLLKTIMPDNRIRKLTPIECERLQSLPDGFTEKGLNENNEEVLISNTQRYKALGNGFNCKVIEHIIKNLK